jgi:hypothetical protein
MAAPQGQKSIFPFSTRKASKEGGGGSSTRQSNRKPIPPLSPVPLLPHLPPCKVHFSLHQQQAHTCLMAQHFSGSNQCAACCCTLEKKGEKNHQRNTLRCPFRFSLVLVCVFSLSCLPPPTRLERRASAFWRSPTNMLSHSPCPHDATAHC